MDNAIVINATSAIVAVPAQYQWLDSRFGEQGVDYSIVNRMQLTGDDGRSFTMHEICLSSGDTRQVFFDITASIGNF